MAAGLARRGWRRRGCHRRRGALPKDSRVGPGRFHHRMRLGWAKRLGETRRYRRRARVHRASGVLRRRG